MKPRGDAIARENPLRRVKRRRGMTLAESAICVAIVGGALVAALSTVGAARASESKIADRALGSTLARALMSEILLLPYIEPTGTPTFGPESGESGSNRAAFDDVDDYHGWSASPPQTKDGAKRAAIAGWREEVRVEYVAGGDLQTPAVSDTGLKRITVTISRNDVTLATLVALRSATWTSSTPN